jgi:DNA-binding response OmpR family regulator
VAAAIEMVGAVPAVAPQGRLSEIAAAEGPEGFAAAVVDATAASVTEAVAVCRQLRTRDRPVAAIFLVLARHQLGELTLREDLFEDFVVAPVDAAELAARIRHRLKRAGHDASGEVIEQGGLLINLETYQASIHGRVLDLTYMEYELLRFLAGNPNRVFTRETLLNRVWGYEYYGGARTVDVHVRRLRAKLGEENAHIIQTVRSVGYKFGAAGPWSLG